ncbi:hypothetical protein QYM36_005069 [Artemia franciscana]|uniref:Heat shock protein 70 n=1 Tax=Artemia franciscana TaxID=6661 RepID=A0AA88I3H1_ARTSF|nr:hypothetical protein QYM36_005069 [Artemia franciscana]
MTKDNNLLGEFELDGIPPAPRGVLQIEVSFDIDANGILNVTAVEKSIRRPSKFTLTNDKDRLSRDEIEQMVNNAERYRAEDEKQMDKISPKNTLESFCFNMKHTLEGAEDEKQRDKISAKNTLESFCFNMKHTLEGEYFKNKISEDDRNTFIGTCNETIKWLDDNQLAEKENFEDKEKQLKIFAREMPDQPQESGGITIGEVD